MIKINKLNSLNIGDTIGVICPSSAEDYEKIKSGISLIKSLGFKVKEGKHIYKRKGYLAGDDKDRAEDLMDMFKDSTVKMILCIRGGYGAMRILPYIDFDIIRENKKIFMGFSDITVLLNTICQRCNFPTFHGPMVTSDLKEPYTYNSFIESITNTMKKPYILENPPHIKTISLVNGKAKGRLVGGNLCLICSTLGTPYEIDFKDNILFIEEIGEAPYKIDRMLTQLLLSGKLQKCRGIILGGFTNCELKDYSKSLKLEEVLKSNLCKLNIPILSNFSSGHYYPKLTLPIGIEVSLDSEKNLINVLSPPFKI